MFRVVYFPTSSPAYESSNTLYNYKLAFELGLSISHLFAEVYITESRWNTITNKMEYILYIVNNGIVYVNAVGIKNMVYSNKPEQARSMKIREEFYKAINLMNKVLKMYKKYIPYTDEYVHSIGQTPLIKMYIRLLSHPCIMRYKNEIACILRTLRDFDIIESEHTMQVKNIYENLSISKLLTVGEDLKEYYGCKDLDTNFT